MTCINEKLAVVQACIGLFQEPWTVQNKVKGVDLRRGNLYYSNRVNHKIRTCIYVSKDINAMFLPQYSTGDLVAVKVEIETARGRGELVLVSAYLPYDATDLPPSRELADLVAACGMNSWELLVGADANAHHIAWGSSGVNARGESLLGFICTNQLQVINAGDKPTFVDRRRKEVIDITFGSVLAAELAAGWHVSDCLTMSDHRRIYFDISAPTNIPRPFRNPRKTNWLNFNRLLSEEWRDNGCAPKNAEGIEDSVNKLNSALLSAYEKACTLITHSGGNREAARIKKVLSKEPSERLGMLRAPSGVYTDSAEQVTRLLLETHFPNCQIDGVEPLNEQPEIYSGSRGDWEKASEIVSCEGVAWAIGGFSPYKTAGTDGIFPALLQQAADIITVPLRNLFRACLAIGYVPHDWRRARIVFIPKPGKSNYEEPKSFRPISLTSFLLKTLEKLCDRYVRSRILIKKPLSPMQHAYQRGKSTESALHQLVSRIEKSICDKEMALVAFLDIEGAFDRVNSAVLVGAMREFGLGQTLEKFITNLVKNRMVEAEVCGSRLSAAVSNGCSQGGVLSSLLWTMVVNSLLVQLNSANAYTQGYADDVCIVIRGKFLSTLCELMQRALTIVEEWCGSSGLRVNPDKTALIVFSRKSWGLSPKITLWMYQAIVRPLISYGAVVWWPRVEYNNSARALQRLQRLACLAITGAIRTAPTAALEVMLSLPPLPLYIKAEAGMAAFRLRTAGTWKVGCHPVGHVRIMDSLVRRHPDLLMRDDFQLEERLPQKNFRPILHTRAEWREHAGEIIEPGTVALFTDGSRVEESSGAGYHCPELELGGSVPLGRNTTVFQAEVTAILVGVRSLIEAGISDRRINIFSDSKAALLSISGYNSRPSLVLECRKIIEMASLNCEITLHWVPGHCGIEGNEEADRLAMVGAKTEFIGPEPAVGVSPQTKKTIIKMDLLTQHQTAWSATRNCRVSRLFMPQVNSKRTEYLVGSKRCKARQRRTSEDMRMVVDGVAEAGMAAGAEWSWMAHGWSCSPPPNSNLI
ncbi:uncharacterized protein LOC129808462 [Phlebotomus papatasi]|uniref:uncharacterized protein LOC129808462 n=1 Tax=Phlebotomus papatasi TaxID=29031 RepID=UPI00248352D9|nr:uncharacterized protein LOC129808462 [Phlebotomus papatasi]